MEDNDNDALTNITDWRLDDTSITSLNLPFDTNITSTTTNAIRDYSTHENNGTIFGSPVWQQSDEGLGGGYYSNNVDANYINVSRPDYGQNFTVEFWIEVYSIDSAVTEVPVFLDHMSTAGDGNSNGEFLCYIDDEGWSNDLTNGDLTNDITCAVQNTGQASLTDISTTSVETTWLDGSPHHIVVRLEDDNLSIFVDGARESTRIYSYTKPRTSNDFIVGYDEWSWGKACNCTIYDFRLYNSSVSDELIGLHANKIYSIIPSQETTKGDTWTVAVTPNDALGDGTTVLSNQVIIESYAPSTPTLIYPPQVDAFFTDRKPLFNWTNSTDADNDPIYYQLELNESCVYFDKVIENGSIPVSQYNQTDALRLDCLYYWRVRANDTQEVSSWTDWWNFTVQPYVDIYIVNNNSDFGSIGVNQENDTTDNSPLPIRVRNDGNIETNISIVNATALWGTVSLNTSYYQFKANNSDESNAFDWDSSSTSWVNMSESRRFAVAWLNYSSERDVCAIDLRILVPGYEPPTTKSSIITVDAEQSYIPCTKIL